jgi:hypothetical protein
MRLPVPIDTVLDAAYIIRTCELASVHADQVARLGEE